MMPSATKLLFCCIIACVIKGVFLQDFQQTGIFIYAPTEPGQLIFIRGGISSGQRPGCDTGDALTDPCAISIRTRVVPSDQDSSYYQLSQGDNVLDWYGKEEGQGDYEGRQALGTPLMWTSQQSTVDGPTIEEDGYGYTAYNRFGANYWFTDLDIDCDQTENGWFEFKVYTLLGGWEQDIYQYDLCAGQPLIPRPYSSINHVAMCGKLNVFFRGEDECDIYEMPDDPTVTPPDSCGLKKMFDDSSPTLNPSPENQSRAAAESPPAVGLIVNGYPASMGRWPWQGVLQYGATIGGCGAVLFDARWAVTAAHCVRGTSPSILKVRIGEQNLAVTQGNEIAMQVVQIHTHECYQNPLCPNTVEGDYDIALLQFAQDVDLSSSYVGQLACLPRGYQVDDFVGKNCFATGFGDTKGTGDSYRLYEINVPVHSHQDCVNTWGPDYISVRQVCMGTDDKSACGGDSGGPLVCWSDDRWVLVGITSWGSGSCQGDPSVYTRMTEFVDWIDTITGTPSVHYV